MLSLLLNLLTPSLKKKVQAKITIAKYGHKLIKQSAEITKVNNSHLPGAKDLLTTNIQQD